MIWPLRSSFARWFFEDFLVVLVYRRVVLDLTRWFFQFFEGNQFGSRWINVSRRQIIRICRSWLNSLEIWKESGCGFIKNLRISCKSQGTKQNLGFGGIWRDSRLQRISLLVEAYMVLLSEIEVVSRDDYLGIFEDYDWQRNRCNYRVFLIQYRSRRLPLSVLITRFDLISTFSGFDLLEFGLLSMFTGSDMLHLGLIWKLCEYKEYVKVLSVSLLAHQLLIFLLFFGFLENISGYGVKVLVVLTLVFSLVNMSQSSMLGKQMVEKSLNAVVSKLRIKIPSFDNSALIACYSKTVIGRCMNPMMQDMKTLLFMFPRFWGMEGRVVGSDLGNGRFRFDFESEEDIHKVLKIEPFHFDHWMVSMVKWEPTVDPAYPSSLKFWIRVVDIPLQFRAELTLKSIGDALGKVVDVDPKGSRVQVILDGFKPLVFDTTIEFETGEETPIALWYEKLQGYCSFCFSLCHDVELCEKKHGVVHSVPSRSNGIVIGEAQNLSYKAVVNQDRQFHPGYEGKGKGISSGKDKEEGRKVHPGSKFGNGKGNQGRFQQGDTSSKHKKFTNYAQMKDNRYQKVQKKMATGSEAGTLQQDQSPKVKKGVRKSLSFQDEGSSIAGTKVSPSEIFEEEKAAGVVGMALEVPMGQSSNHSDLELGEIDPAPIENFSTVIADEVNQTGLVTLDSEVEMEPEDENEALDRVLKEMEDAIAAGEIIPMVELETTDDGTGIQNLVVEEMETEVNHPNSGLILETEETIGNKAEMAFADLVDEMEPVVGANLGKGKHKESQVTKRKPGKGIVIPGVNSRKRNVQALISPRKRPGPKGGPNAGGDFHPTDQGQEKGGPGGSKPPK